MDLDRIVKGNRSTISVIFPVVGALMFILSFEHLLPEFLAYNPFLILTGTLVMRLPLVAGLLPLADKRFLTGIGLLTVYSYLIEYVGISTGFPYGFFSYGIDLGPMILDKIPLGLPVFFIPLVLNSYILGLLLWPKKTEKLVYRLAIVASTVVFLDLILDPAAVGINFWSYTQSGYYGVPITNYLGWVLSATVSVAILDRTIDRSGLSDRLKSCDYMLDDMVSFVFIWGIINLYFGNMVPFILSIVLGCGLYSTERFDFVPVIGKIKNIKRLS